MEELADLRTDYDIGVLRREDLLDDPVDQWKQWFDAASQADVYEPNAMVVATVDTGAPSSVACRAHSSSASRAGPASGATAA